MVDRQASRTPHRRRRLAVVLVSGPSGPRLEAVPTVEDLAEIAGALRAVGEHVEVGGRKGGEELRLVLAQRAAV